MQELKENKKNLSGGVLKCWIADLRVSYLIAICQWPMVIW
jgi:hypothetical protein